MTVWIVNPFDNLPHEGFRPQRYWIMAKAFAAAGHRAVCWTSDFSHALKRRRVMRREVPVPGVELKLVPTMPYGKNICLSRILSHMRLAQSWEKLAAAELVRPDAVVASLPPLGLCGRAMKAARRAGAVFVADVMDAWPETFERIAPAWALAPLRNAARRIYRSADAVSAVARRYLDLAADYGCTAPMKLCHHGIEMPPVPAAPRRPRAQRHGAFKLVYIGSMGASYDLMTLIEAVKGMPGVELDLAGAGPREPALREAARGIQGIRFHGYLGEEDDLRLLRGADAGIVPMFPDSCVGVPYKLADYAAAGLCIAECLGGETRELVESRHAGCHYEPGSAESLKNAVRRLSDSAGEWNPAGLAAEFDAARLMPDYVRWVESAVARGKGPAA